MNNKIRKLLLVVCAVVFVFSIYKLTSIQLEYKEIEKETEEVIEEFVTEPEVVVKEEKDETTGEVKEKVDWHAVALKRTVDFDSLLKKNGDVVGWLYIPDTRIDEPILIGETNDEYLKTNINGQKRAAGSIFVDSVNTGTFLDRNTVIHGHNMKNGSRFHNLRYFTRSSYLKEHDKIYIYLPDGSINVYQVMASLVVDAYSDLYVTGYKDYNDYVKRIKKASTQFVDLGDQETPLIMLSTCYDRGSEDRYVVYGKWIENVRVEP